MNERYRPQPEVQEAHFSGLLSKQDIQANLDKLDAPFILTTNDYAREKTLVLEAAEHPAVVTETDYREYREDVEQDRKGLERRLQRLKLRVLEHLLAGTMPNPEGLSWAQQEQTPLGKIKKKLSYYVDSARKISQEDYQTAIRELNTLLPATTKIQIDQNLGAGDIIALNEVVGNMIFKRPISESERKKWEIYLNEINELEQTIGQSTSQGELFAPDQQKPINEEVYKRAWDRYRELVKELSTTEELSSWYSPTHNSSGKGQRGKEQKSEQFRTDYQRFSMPEMSRLESLLTQDYVFPKAESRPNANSFLFNSGLAALQAVLMDITTWRRQETDKPERLFLVDKGVYFETPALIQDSRKDGKNYVEVEQTDAEHWMNQILKQLPEAVFLDPLSIGVDMRVSPLSELCQMLKKLPFEKRFEIKRQLEDRFGKNARINLIVDNTPLGTLATWKEHLQGLPDFIRVYIIESLVKYSQDGQEYSQAGLVTTVSTSSYHSEGIKELQARAGFRPPESVARRLAAIPPSEEVEQKMQRHCRNAERLATMIQQHIQPKGYLGNVVYPSLAQHPDHERIKQEARGASGLFHIRIGPETFEGHQSSPFGRPYDKYDGADRANKVAEKFAQTIIEIAKQMGIEINQGTSYGFSTTRIAVYQHTPLRLPYLRVAVGTENAKDILLIAEVFKRADDLFSKAYQNDSLELLLANKSNLQLGQPA